MSQADLLSEQGADPSLKQLFNHVDIRKDHPAYFLHHDLLMRRWILHEKYLTDTSVVHVVLPVKYRQCHQCSS